MPNDIARLFFQEIQNQLMFLMTEYKFAGPISNFKENDDLYVYEVWFLGKNLAIEFALDWRDKSIDCYIAKLSKGIKPEGWLFDRQGNHVRVRLSDWVRNQSVTPVRLFSKVDQRNFQEQIPIVIGDYAHILRSYGNSILNDRNDIFL